MASGCRRTSRIAIRRPKSPRNIETWRQDDNEQRPNSALNYLLPAEFAPTATEMQVEETYSSSWVFSSARDQRKQACNRSRALPVTFDLTKSNLVKRALLYHLSYVPTSFECNRISSALNGSAVSRKL
jgi:hypothetical protein